MAKQIFVGSICSFSLGLSACTHNHARVATPQEIQTADRWVLSDDTRIERSDAKQREDGSMVVDTKEGERKFTMADIASVQTALARPGIAPYTATKGAVANLTKGMATDWARHGLQCNAIAPGYFDTPLNAALVADPEFSAWHRLIAYYFITRIEDIFNLE